MKSREGTVVDADDLMDAMVQNAKEMSAEMGKLQDLPQEEADKISAIIGLGALKYFILKVDPRKNMTFNPKESIDFNIVAHRRRHHPPRLLDARHRSAGTHVKVVDYG